VDETGVVVVVVGNNFFLCSAPYVSQQCLVRPSVSIKEVKLSP
jgi:hypothetical protein